MTAIGTGRARRRHVLARLLAAALLILLQLVAVPPAELTPAQAAIPVGVTSFDDYCNNATRVFVTRASATVGPMTLTGLTQGAGGLTGYDFGTPPGTISYNATAMGPGNVMYAVRAPRRAIGAPAQLLAINPNGDYVDLGDITGIDSAQADSPGYTINAGAFIPGTSKYYFYNSGIRNSIPARQLYWIDVSGAAANGIYAAQKVGDPSDVKLPNDFGYAEGYFWGVNSEGRIVRIDPNTGTATLFDRPNDPLFPLTQYGSAWTYGNGNFGVMANNTGTFYQFDIIDAGTAQPTFKVISSGPGYSSGNNDATACLPVPTDLAISKTGSTVAAPGATVPYTITVRNVDSKVSSGYSFTDVLPVGWTTTVPTTPTSYGDGMCESKTVTDEFSGDSHVEITCFGANLQQNGSHTYQLPIKMPATFTRCGVNVVTVIGNEEDLNAANNTGQAETCPPLRTTKTLASVNGVAATSTTAVAPGDVLVYKISTTNIGSTPQSTKLTETVPTGTSYTGTSQGWSCTTVAAGGLCTQTVSVQAGTTVDTRFTVKALTSLSGTIDNAVTASQGTCLTCSTSNAAYIPAVAVDKTASTDVLNVSGNTPVTYSYAVTNPGNEPLQAITISDDKCAPLNRTGGDTNGDNQLQPGETWTYTCAATLTVATTNTVTVSAAGIRTTKTVTATDSFTVIKPPLTIEKTSNTGGTPVKAGQTITYSVKVTNSSSTPAENVTLTDPLPAGVSYISGSAKKTYPRDVSTTTTATGTFTKDLTTTTSGPDYFDKGTYTLSYAVTNADVPAGAVLTGYSISTTGNTIDWLRDLSLRTTYPGGQALSAAEVGSFGGPVFGSWSKHTAEKALTGTALGNYSFAFTDPVNGRWGSDNRVDSAAAAHRPILGA